MVGMLAEVPTFVRVVLILLAILGSLFVCISVLVTAKMIADEKKSAREKEHRELKKFYDSVSRIARSCERIEDVMTHTEILSTVEVTEEIKYDG